MVDTQHRDRGRLSKILNHISPPAPNNLIHNQTSNKILSKIYPTVSEKLQSIFGDRYIESDRILLKHGREVIGSARSRPPTAVIYPLTTDEISQALKICNCHQPPINIIPYAAGSSLESHILSSDHQKERISITINVTKMNQILSVYPDDMQCTVQPGVNWVKLNKALAEHNLFLGVDPAPAACIGGMVGCCCSGPSALKVTY